MAVCGLSSASCCRIPRSDLTWLAAPRAICRMIWTPPVYDPSRELRDTLPADAWRVPVELIARRHGLASDSLFPFPTGSDIVWSAGDRVIKLTAPKWATEIASEAAGLRRVRGRLPVDTAAVEAVGALEGWPYIVMTRVAGRPLGEAWPGLDPGARMGLAADLGRLTRVMHGLAGADEAGGWPAFWARCTADVPGHHAERGAPALLAREVGPFLEAEGPLRPSGFGLLHTELLDAHVLVTERAGQTELCGLIDFADSRVGPADYEFAAPVEFVFKGEAGVLRAFLLGYGDRPDRLDHARSRQMLAWALCHRFGDLARMVAACGGGPPDSLDALASRLYGLDA